MAALSHPNLLAIFDTGIENGISYAVTELLDGESLRIVLRRGPLAWRKAVEIGTASAEGLAAAHSKGITHRDLKPENIFLATDGRVKILDFGLPRVERAQTAADADTRTGAGTVLGTPGYMSPEQVRGVPAGPTNDIFSFVCVLYEMIAGRRAFESQTVGETMSSILRDTPTNLCASGTQIPGELGRLIFGCLEKNCEQGFQSARDLAFHFKPMLSAPSAVAQGHAPSTRSRSCLSRTLAAIRARSIYAAELRRASSTSLAQIAQLRVMPRSTVFRYKACEADPQTIGRKLNVRLVVAGRVIQRRENLVVSAELVDVAAGSQIWGERYHRKMSDIFALEEEIARKISESLRLKLSGQEKARLVKRSKDNTEAYLLYLRGRSWRRSAIASAPPIRKPPSSSKR